MLNKSTQIMIIIIDKKLSLKIRISVQPWNNKHNYWIYFPLYSRPWPPRVYLLHCIFLFTALIYIVLLETLRFYYLLDQVLCTSTIIHHRNMTWSGSDAFAYHSPWPPHENRRLMLEVRRTEGDAKTGLLSITFETRKQAHSRCQHFHFTFHLASI